MSDADGEIIVVRSLTESDLGLFAAHRAEATSNQRAININADVARRLLSVARYAAGQADLMCICAFGKELNFAIRRISKPKKNWRLGGEKIRGDIFGQLDSKDFALIRSVAKNDGSQPINIAFISKKTDRIIHAGLAAIVERRLNGSMVVFEEGNADFTSVATHCPRIPWTKTSTIKKPLSSVTKKVALMPFDSDERLSRPKTIREKLRTPHILAQMLKVAGDLSAPAQLRFMEIVEELASQLRCVLLECGGIVQIDKNHAEFWEKIAGQRVGFVDGGLANLSMFGSAPIAARVGGYSVVPGARGPERESFIVLKHLIDELYSHDAGGVFTDSFPDIGALRDAARISIEAAGAVRLLVDHADLKWVQLHGALVNPVSRYTDMMRDGRVKHRFPDFSDAALADLLPLEEPSRQGRHRNFISVHLRQLQLLATTEAVVCGVIERESTTTSVCRAVLDSLDDETIRPLLHKPPVEWKKEFRNAIDPSGDDEYEGQRITDSLLFRCVLEPGEALLPVVLDRNELSRAPDAWRDVIRQYPKPHVSYLHVTDWNAPVRLELFEKDVRKFKEVAELIMHCSLLLPRYAFPVGLDIVDKFARIPDWISRPVNTRTAVRALKTALDNGDSHLFDSLRRMLCGSGREFLLRPGIFR